MKKHSGMRSQDIVVLLKIAALREAEWFGKDMAYALGISQSEVSESLNRSQIAGLLSDGKKRLMKNNLLDFLQHGLRYVFPAEPGAIQRGMPTAHNAPPLNQHISAEEPYVWPWAEGEARGQAIEPLHRLFGTAPDDKVMKAYATDHIPPKAEFVTEILKWLDRYLGPVGS